jgi:hypothetical protein
MWCNRGTSNSAVSEVLDDPKWAEYSAAVIRFVRTRGVKCTFNQFRQARMAVLPVIKMAGAACQGRSASRCRSLVQRIPGDHFQAGGGRRPFRRRRRLD